MAEQLIDRPVAVVTGASSGFGEAIVHRLANQGWLTIGVARREDRLVALAEEVDGEYAVCDLTEPDHISAVAAEILGEHPGIDLLVNNAGMALRERFVAANDAAVAEVMDTNYLGPFRLTRALLPGLVGAAPSNVINVVSAAGAITNPSSGPYGASKHAQLALSRCQTVELRSYGVNVHAILPGKANTEGHPQRQSHSPLSRLTRTDIDTVAEAVIGRIGKNSGEVYVPRILGVVAALNTVAPVTTGRAISKLIS